MVYGRKKIIKLIRRQGNDILTKETNTCFGRVTSGQFRLFEKKKMMVTRGLGASIFEACERE